MKYKEGIIFSSCCYLSEIGQAFDRSGPDAAEDMLQKYMAMFQGNFYLEIMLLDYKKQKPYDKWLITMHDKYHLPMIVTQDCHYCKKEDSKYQQYMLMTRTKNTVQDIERAKLQGGAEERFFELQDTNLWMKSEDELNDKWLSDYQDAIPYEIFCDAKRNTVEVCRRAEGVEIDRSIKLPQLPDADAKLLEAVGRGLKWRGLWNKPRYMNQLQREYELICRKDFASYFLITKKITDEARRVCPKILGWGTGAEAIGPGRGSAVGFLTCFVLGITDVDPIKHDLLPERFLSDARGGRQLKLEFESEPIGGM
jgi:DNA polymerase-3 subunit alpha